jgi:hypothetical protein
VMVCALADKSVKKNKAVSKAFINVVLQNKRKLVYTINQIVF